MTTAQSGERAQVVEENLARLAYCITSKPRLFRWRNGNIEWSPARWPRRWRVLPMALSGGKDLS